MRDTSGNAGLNTSPSKINNATRKKGEKKQRAPVGPISLIGKGESEQENVRQEGCGGVNTCIGDTLNGGRGKYNCGWDIFCVAFLATAHVAGWYRGGRFAE